MVNFELGRGQFYPDHEHPVHQLAWSPTGVLTVRSGVRSWVLPSNLGLFIPAGLRHSTGAQRATTMLAPYLDPARCALDWAEPTVVRIGALARALIEYLADRELPDARRQPAEQVLSDVLAPVGVATIDVRGPADPRAAEVAKALAADPADDRSLEAWGRKVGASVRTLTRAFAVEPGTSFTRYRTQVRLRAALSLLADGVPVGTVAHRVGYRSPSAFIAAFRRQTGVAPGGYFTEPE
ncbi:helix-turn-helix transcriptional regulator [Pseudonocardia ailaonensis]|uniref:Helix-turn-helix transcriptional regulator n=1 Tax=Pseudonocardia ailaonensis TaxID=367279 RepID=A0ABN2NIL4_9PSEU